MGHGVVVADGREGDEEEGKGPPARVDKKQRRQVSQSKSTMARHLPVTVARLFHLPSAPRQSPTVILGHCTQVCSSEKRHGRYLRKNVIDS